MNPRTTLHDERPEPGDDEAMSAPRVFDSEEEAFAAPTAEEQWLENQDSEGDDE